jgi:flagellum-specific ATP synthase
MHLAERRQRVVETPGLVVEGQLTRMVGLTLEAAGCVAPVGARCLVVNPNGEQVEAEVVGFAGGKLFLMPSGDIHGLMPNARVIPTGGVSQARIGEGLLGRVLDGSGRFLDGLPPPAHTELVSLTGKTINP